MLLAVGDAESRSETVGGYVLYRRMGVRDEGGQRLGARRAKSRTLTPGNILLFGRLRACAWHDDAPKADGMIDKLAVAESWRRRGIGRRLLRAAIDALRAKRCVTESSPPVAVHPLRAVWWALTAACSRCKTVRLLVDVERREARALYDAEGFQTLSTRKDYYREGRDALWMELPL